MMRRILFLLLFVFAVTQSVFSQQSGNNGVRILFQGLVMDESTFSPIANTQIMINRAFSSVSGTDGTFAFYVSRNDTVLFKSLGYKPTRMYISDTLAGGEFIAGIFMSSDTLMIGEVIIVPRLSNLKSEILNARSKTPANFDNARYNVAVSAYQGRNSLSTLGNPADNYALIMQRQKVNAYEKGGIPSDRMVGISPLLLFPAAYILIKGLPEKPAPLVPRFTEQEVDQIHKKYIETLKQRK